MTGDAYTMAWKEWKELLAPQGRFRGGAMNLLLLLGIFGIAMPWQFGRAWVESPMMLLYWGWVPLLLLSNVVVDAFAGERERHTLETLLATRLPDRAILFGKIGAAVAYALAIAAASLLLGLVTVNVLVRPERLLLYPPATLAGAIVTNVLGAALIAGLGVLVSLRSASVRQAGQLMGIAVLVVGFAPVLGVRALSAYWRSHGHAVTAADAALAGLAGLGLFILLDTSLIAAAVLRFRRSRLLLD
jgi:ABC-2 type transport system permease protein